MRLTEQTRYALRVLAVMAKRHPDLVRVTDLAVATGISEFNIFKLLKVLTKTGFVRSVRGRHGGVRLAAPPEALSAGRLVRVLEPRFQVCGPAAAMALPAPVAEAEARVDQVIGRGIGAFLAELDAVSIGDLVADRPLADDRPAA